MFLLASILSFLNRFSLGVKGTFGTLTEDVGPRRSVSNKPAEQPSSGVRHLLSLIFGDPLNSSMLREENARRVFWLSLVTPEDGEITIAPAVPRSVASTNWRKTAPSASSSSSSSSSSISKQN